LADILFLSRTLSIMNKRTIAPDSNRIIVKLAASITCVFNAKRHNIEFAANAMSAKQVNIIVLNT